MKKVKITLALSALLSLSVASQAAAASSNGLQGQAITAASSDWVVRYYTRSTGTWKKFIRSYQTYYQSQWPSQCVQRQWNVYQDHIKYERVQVWYSGREAIVDQWNQPQGSEYAEMAWEVYTSC